jgi:hypothetical protein
MATPAVAPGQHEPNEALQQTAVAMLVPREFKALSAAAAAERGRSAIRRRGVGDSDPVFGPLAWHDGFLRWKGEISWPDTDRVEVLLDEQDREAGCPVARQSLEWVRANEPEIRRAVATEFLAWCNGTFAPDHPVSEEEFLRTVELHQLQLEGDGSLQVLYFDMHLFGGLVFYAWFAADKSLEGFTVD